MEREREREREREEAKTNRTINKTQLNTTKT